jgi:lipoyl(octanoyl) transferase
VTTHIGELATLVAGKRWRLIVDAECGAEWNMAVDCAILDAVAMKLSPPTVRLYRWDGPAVSIGRSQKLSTAVAVEACRTLGVPVIRRPTGGRAVLHGGDQTLSIVVPVAALGAKGGSVVASYRLLSEGIIAGLGELGLDVRFALESPQPERSEDCFASRARVDLVTPGGGKLVGSAQRRSGGVILQQSSVRHFEAPVDAQAVLLGPVGHGGYPLSRFDEDEVEKAFVAGFEKAFGSALQPASLSHWELERAAFVARGRAPGTVVDSAPGV